MIAYNYFQIINSFEKIKQIETKLIIGKHVKRVKPFFSIIIPTYKRPKLLKEAINSALNQNYNGVYEIIVVDDEVVNEQESPTEKIIKNINSDIILYYRNNQNLGQHGNWNRCIELSNGEWICMLHDDDMLDPNYLADLNDLIQSRYDIGFIACRLNLLIQNKNAILISDRRRKIMSYFRKKVDIILPKFSKIRVVDYLFGFKTYVVGSCFKKELAIKLGGFNQTFFPSSDYYFVVNFQWKYNNVYFLKKKNYTYRILNNESLNLNTFSKFIINDFYFTRNLITEHKYKFSKFLLFLNKQYVIQRVISGGNIYGVKLDLEKIMVELDISPSERFFLRRIIGKTVFKILYIYRNLIKY